MIKTKKQILINWVVFFLGSMSVCYGTEEIKDPNIRCKNWAFNHLYSEQQGQAGKIQQAITDVRKIALSKPGSCKNKITNKNKLKAKNINYAHNFNAENNKNEDSFKQNGQINFPTSKDKISNNIQTTKPKYSLISKPKFL